MQTKFASAIRLLFWSLSSRMWKEQGSTRPFIEPVIDKILSHSPPCNGLVLDLGCGAGIYSVALAEAGYNVIGADGAIGMLAQARQKITPGLAGRLKFESVNADGKLPYANGEFATVIAISVLQALVCPEYASREVYRVLRPGGIFIVLHFRGGAHLHFPLSDAIRRRIELLKQKSILNMMMATVKTLGERYGGTRYWTSDELNRLLSSGGFCIEPFGDSEVMIAVAQKPAAPLGA